MARHVFFSFHYEDIWRVNQVRYSQQIKGESETSSFVDAAELEKVKRRGPNAVERWIDRQLVLLCYKTMYYAPVFIYYSR